MNFSLSSRLVRPRADEREEKHLTPGELESAHGRPSAGAVGAASKVRRSFGCRHQSPCTFDLCASCSGGRIGQYFFVFFGGGVNCQRV